MLLQYQFVYVPLDTQWDGAATMKWLKVWVAKPVNFELLLFSETWHDVESPVKVDKEYCRAWAGSDCHPQVGEDRGAAQHRGEVEQERCPTTPIYFMFI